MGDRRRLAGGIHATTSPEKKEKKVFPSNNKNGEKRGM